MALWSQAVALEMIAIKLSYNIFVLTHPGVVDYPVGEVPDAEAHPHTQETKEDQAHAQSDDVSVGQGVSLLIDLMPGLNILLRYEGIFHL